MSDKFPHLADTQYPDLANSNVWQYENNFDYSKFDDVQMHIKICSVPWDLGEVHVGLVSVPMGNVIGWESKKERDNYLDGLEGIEFDTHYRCYHDGETIKLPLPYEYMALHNYIIVDYSRPPVEFNDGTGISRFLFFIRDLKQLSINTTQCEIKRDTWSMFINDIDFSYMQFERGHYPLAKSATVEKYLQSPINHTDYLLTPDVSYGEALKTHEVGKLIENSIECWYVIACTSNPRSTDWGSGTAASKYPKSEKPWNTPANSKSHTEQDCPSYFIFAISKNNIETFWENIQNDTPQFMQSVVAVYLISKELAYAEVNFTFGNVTCHLLKRYTDIKNIGELNKELFNYPDSAKELTKLYTSPYCHIEFTDGEGNTAKVQLENISSNELQVVRYLSIAYPFCNVKTYLHGIGGEDRKNVKYYALNERNFDYSGKWYNYVWSHDIPTYGIFESSYKNNYYSQWFNRYSNWNTARNNADVTKTVSDKNADASKTIADTSANAAIENTAVQNACNVAVTDDANSKVTISTQKTNDCMTAEIANDNYLLRKLANASASAAVQSASISSNANVQTTLNSAQSGIITATISGFGGLLSGGDIAGNALNALAGIANSAVNYQTASTNASISSGAVIASSYVGANLTETQAQSNADRNDTKNTNQVIMNNAMRDIQIAYNSTVTNQNNSAATAITANNAATAKTNATTQKTITKENNVTIKNNSYENADFLVAAQKNNAGMQAPLIHGQFTNGDYQAVKPRGIWASIITQPDDCILQAASEFKRFGYFWDGSVKFETFNVMSKFSYWKVKDIWAIAKNLPDAWVDEIRNFLLKGVTIWRKPEYIGHTGIDENERS